MSHKKPLAKVFHYDLYGKREYKYSFLNENSLEDIDWTELPNKAPNYFMTPKDFEAEERYNKGIKINDLFPVNSVGIVTSRDDFVIDENKNKLEERIIDFFNLEKGILLNKYSLKESKSWKIDAVKLKAKQFIASNIAPILYRPFDKRFLYNDAYFIERSRTEVMQHFLKGKNVGLVFKLGNAEIRSASAIITQNIIDFRSWSRPGMQGGDYIAPLYLYPETNGQQTIEESSERKPNLNPKIVNEIAEKLGLIFTHEKEESENSFAPLDILDYIYAVLHSPSYREKYKEFLKIDFPRVPYPQDKKMFGQLVKLGSEIRQIHLLESPKVNDYITTYPQDGSNIITTRIAQKDWELFDKEKQTGRIWINETQYFDKIPLTAWEFYIGGYQPAQKWLKDRKNRTLSYEDIRHYQKIIVALYETGKLMGEVGELGVNL